MHVLLVVISLLLCILPNIASGQALDRTYVNYFNPLQYGSSCTAATLNGAISALSSTKATLILTRTDRAKVNCTWTLSSNVTTNTNTTIYIPAGTVLSPNSGITVTFNGPVQIDDIASLQGAGAFVFNYPQKDIQKSYFLSGCLPTSFTGMSLDAFACTANIIIGGKNFSVQQATAALPLSGTDGIYYIAFDFSTTRTVSSWTRISGTRYLYRKVTTRPTDPIGTVVFGMVDVNSTTVRKYYDLRVSNSRGDSYISAKDPLWGCTGDGATDDTACMQAIANRVSVSVTAPTSFHPQSVPKVVFPEGVYCANDTISWEIVIGLSIEGQGSNWQQNVVPGAVEIRWCAGLAQNKPLWWFKQALNLDIGHLSIKGAREGIRLRRNETCNSGAVQTIAKVRIHDNYFSEQEYAALWIGYPIVATTCDDDVTEIDFEQNYCETDVGGSSAAQTGACVVGNVATNGYNLRIRNNRLKGSQAVVTQGFKNMEVSDNTIITTPYPGTTRYPIYAVSGGGYYNVIRNYTENGLFYRMDSPWTGSGQATALFINNEINSQESYSDVGSVPTIQTTVYTTFIGQRVSNAACSLVRHVNFGIAGGVTIGTSACDIYDNRRALTQIGYCNQQASDTSTVGGQMCLMQSVGVGAAEKGLIIRRCDDSGSACLDGQIFEVKRFDGASSVMRIDGSGRIVTNDKVIANRFNGSAVHFADLGSVINGEFGYCDDCTPNSSPCTGSSTGTLFVGKGGAWQCLNLP